jgi:hypothetical protein
MRRESSYLAIHDGTSNNLKRQLCSVCWPRFLRGWERLGHFETSGQPEGGNIRRKSLIRIIYTPRSVFFFSACRGKQAVSDEVPRILIFFSVAHWTDERRSRPPTARTIAIAARTLHYTHTSRCRYICPYTTSFFFFFPTYGTTDPAAEYGLFFISSLLLLGTVTNSEATIS